MSDEQADAAVNGRAEQMGRELRDTVALIYQYGGAVVFEEFPGAVEDPPPPGFNDGAKASGTRAAWDPDVAARRMLFAAADALAETLAQLDPVALGLRARPSGSTTS